ncbi:MAG: carbohydrate-binding family 9-like protein [Deltaproteobacteria bacterium]|nr:carbohydrate-binding family 9-like protein [Deltaproteobacteria bacterium]
MRRGILAVALVASCQDQSSPLPKDALLTARPTPRFPTSATFIERSGRGRARYLGFDLTGEPRSGATLTLQHYFEVEAPFIGDYAVHVALATEAQDVVVADHQPIAGRAPTSRWEKGQIWVDTHTIKLPDPSASSLEVLVALFAGEARLTVEAPPGGSDGRDRAKAGTLRVSGGRSELPEVRVPRRTRSEIQADGKLDEADWAVAPVLGFEDSLGRDEPTKHPTRLRLLWDDTNLYVGFESSDPDISDPYRKRDDPIYEHETVEIFLMPNRAPPDLGPYLELQASPRGVIFDAAFVGRRRGMDTTFNAGQTVGTVVDGTIDSFDDVDRSWTSEWIVPFAGLRGVNGAPKAGEVWRMNAFRIDKKKSGERYEGEYTAWSPPRVGDFHAIDRFGSLIFVGTATVSAR